MSAPADISRRALLGGIALVAAGAARAGASDAGVFMQHAFAQRRAAEAAGDQPYGAVLVQGGRIVGEAPSAVVTARDPTAHAEMEAIRAARRAGHDLAGATLYSTSRPCAMCEAAAYNAGIARMIHGTELADAGAPRPPLADPGLIAAAARGDAAEIVRLIRGGAAVEARDASGRTALLAATHGNHVEAARVLISIGADVNARDAIQDSPYLYAGAEGRLEILRLTLANGADLGSVNRYGGTALIPAAHHGHVETVRALLATAIDVDHVNRLGWTALLEAVILGDGGPAHTEIVRLLIAARAKLDLADRDGVTALQHARRKNQAGIARLLAAAGAR